MSRISRNLETELGEPRSKQLEVGTFPRDPKYILRRPGIRLDDVDTLITESHRKIDAAPGESLHVTDQCGVRPNPARPKDSFGLPNNTSYSPTRTIIDDRDSPTRETQRCVDRYQIGSSPACKVHYLFVAANYAA